MITTLITYDITSPRRLSKVAKACENYGIRVQDSVFECNCNTAKLKELKLKLSQVINMAEDSVRFYKINKTEDCLDILGKTEKVEIITTSIFEL